MAEQDSRNEIDFRIRSQYVDQELKHRLRSMQVSAFFFSIFSILSVLYIWSTVSRERHDREVLSQLESTTRKSQALVEAVRNELTKDEAINAARLEKLQAEISQLTQAVNRQDLTLKALEKRVEAIEQQK